MKTEIGIVSIFRSIFFERPKRFSIIRGIGIFGVNELRYALEDADVECGPWAYDLFISGQFQLSKVMVRCELISVTAEDLGVREGDMVTREEVYMRAQREGMHTCPPDIGPLMWLQYPDVIESGKRFAIGMEPIPDSKGESSIFCVQYRRKERGIYGAHGEPHQLWHSDHKWIFAYTR